jgi:uncharacterized membrane protein
MQGIYRFLRSTVIGGLVFLVPVVVLGAIVVWAVETALKVVAPLYAWLPDKSIGGVSLTVVSAVVGVVVSCFLAGLFAETCRSPRHSTFSVGLASDFGRHGRRSQSQDECASRCRGGRRC